MNYSLPWQYGPEGPPPAAEHAHHTYDATDMGMAGLVLGITVSDDNMRLRPAEAVIPPAAAEKRLFVRERPPVCMCPPARGSTWKA
jgi:hypothetical protein